MSTANRLLSEDAEFIRQFETCTLPKEQFHHQDHVRLVWLYLARFPVMEVLNRFSEGLKRFATANGKSSLYHETITWTFVFLIHERIARLGQNHNWDDFAAANPDLLQWPNSLLKSYYRDETIKSELARRSFILPDRPPASQ